MSNSRKRRRAIRWARFFNQQTVLIGADQVSVSGTASRRMYDIGDEGWLRVRRQRRDRNGASRIERGEDGH